MFEKHELFRVAKNSRGDFTFDSKSKFGGRGAYVCKNAVCITRAAKSLGLERSFGAKKTGKNAINRNDDLDIYSLLMDELKGNAV